MEKTMTPTKKELAQYKALNDVGLTANAVAVRMKRDPKTVRKYLRSDVYKDPEMVAMVDTIKKTEIAYLYFLGAKSGKRPHEWLDKGNISSGGMESLIFKKSSQKRNLFKNRQGQQMPG